MRKFDCSIHLWFNTGTINASVANPNATTSTYSIDSAKNTFSNTCPFTLYDIAGTSANGGIPTTTTRIIDGLNIDKHLTTSFHSF